MNLAADNRTSPLTTDWVTHHLSTQCFFVPPAQTYCWPNSPKEMSVFSVAHVPTFTASTQSSKTRWSCRGRKWTTCWVEQMLSKTPTLPQFSVPTWGPAEASAPFSWKSRSGLVTNLQQFSTAVASVATSGKKTETAHVIVKLLAIA